MPMIYGLTVEAILSSSLILMRISGILFALPFFGDQPTPVRVRILLSIALTFLIIGLVDFKSFPSLPDEVAPFIFIVLKELAVGLFIGFVARLAFDAIVMAASIVGFQMGFGVADLFMPDADVQMNAFTAFHRILMISIFLALNLHQIYFSAIVKTFELIPVGSIRPNPELGAFLVKATGDLFMISMQLAAPVLIALLFTTTALGLIARTVPQLNVFTLSFPIGFFVGLLVYVACLPFFPGWSLTHFSGSNENILQTIKGLVP